MEEFIFVLNKYQGELINESNESNELEIVQNRIAEINRVKTRYKLDFDGLILKQSESIDFLESIDSKNPLEIFEKEEIKRMPVIESGEVVGLLTLRNLVTHSKKALDALKKENNVLKSMAEQRGMTRE